MIFQQLIGAGEHKEKPLHGRKTNGNTHTRTLQIFSSYTCWTMKEGRRQEEEKKADGFANPAFDFDSAIKCSFRSIFDFMTPLICQHTTHRVLIFVKPASIYFLCTAATMKIRSCNVSFSFKTLFFIFSLFFQLEKIYVYLYIASSTELTVNIFDCNYFQLKEKSL